MSTAPPTTVVPTTAAPTTVATTVTPTTVLTTVGPTTVLPDVTIDAGPIELELYIRVTVLHSPAAGRDTGLDIYKDAGAVEVTVTILGDFLNQSVASDAINIYVTILGDLNAGISIEAGHIDIELSISGLPDIAVNVLCGMVSWSKIGYLDFTIDESNVAGYRPMPWRGCVYDILKLGSSWVVYGENGVTVMTPTGINHAMQTIHWIGTPCKGAVVGTEAAHYFIDKTNKLYRLSSDGLKLLDYSEYLSLMTNPRLTMDIETGIIYICDGEYGYVYSTLSNSFGSGPINVTGVGVRDGTLYVASPDAIEVPKFDICTDIYDLGTRRPKTIQWLEIGTNLTYYLQAMIEARHNYNADFIKSKWALVNPSGICNLPCHGVEFKFHLRSYVYEYLELDYIKVTGTIHGFTYLDTLGYTYRAE